MPGVKSRELNEEQKAAVEFSRGPLLIVAGAGTGKTTVITEKIVRFIESGQANPEQILALTFTDKAAEEMVTRVDERLEIGYTELAISTFHTFCQRLLEHYGLDIGLPNHFKLLSKTESWLLVHEHLFEIGLDYYKPLGNPTRHIHELIKHFSKCKDELIDPSDYLRYAENSAHNIGDDNGEEKSRLTEIANAYHIYNQLLLKAGALDFGDLIYYAVKLLREKQKIREELKKQYKFILIDEFQDVNWAQYELVRLLAGVDAVLTVVGDDDQSIYAFRGASVSNILRFKDDYANAKEIVLNSNYRSDQTILDAAYASIQNNNPDRLEVKLGVNKKLKSKVSAESKNSKSNGTKNSKSKVTHLRGATLDEEVSLVVNEICRIARSDKTTSWDDFAVLVRANSHAEPFIRAFENAKIPYEFLSCAGLYRQPIVLDIYNFFKVIDQYHESSAIYRLLIIPCLEFSENDLQKFTSEARRKSVSYYEGLKFASEWALSSAGVLVCQRLLSMIHAGMRAARAEKPSVIMYRFLEDSGYLRHLARQETNGNNDAIRQINYLKQWFEFVTRYEISVADHKVSNFVAYMTSILDSGDDGKLYQPSDTPDSVNILSVHGAKGLEFRNVFIVNLVEDHFPTRNRGDGIELPLDLVNERLPEGDYHIEEERRLFYVAITRAKERVYFTSAQTYGAARKKRLSRFLIELGYSDDIEVAKIKGIKSFVTPSLGRDAFTCASRSSLGVIKSNISASSVGILPSQPIASLSSVATKNKLETRNLPAAFSFSQIKAYETCPYQYKLAHILKIPTKGNASFSFGQTMHSTLQRFYQRVRELNSSSQASLFDLSSDPATSKTHATSETKKEAGTVNIQVAVKVPSLDDLLNIYDESWIPDWYKNKHQLEDYYKTGRDILKKFYNAEDGNWTVPVTLEGWFKIKVGDYTVHGRIDRIDQLQDGSLEIVDYKTGKSKEKLTADDKDQLLIYQIAAESLSEYARYGKPTKLTFYYINDLIRTSFIGDNEDLNRIKNKLTSEIDKIKTGDFAATPSSVICGHCDFRDICEFRA